MGMPMGSMMPGQCQGLPAMQARWPLRLQQSCFLFTFLSCHSVHMMLDACTRVSIVQQHCGRFVGCMLVHAGYPNRELK